MRSIRTLLEGLIDYAGLFPPARLDMATAAGNYARYRSGEHAWLLGRLIVPLSRLDELEAAVAALPSAGGDAPWQLSLLPGDDLAVAAVRLRELAYGQGRLQVSALELPVRQAEEINHALAVLPDHLEVFFELPLDGDFEALLGTLRGRRAKAKVRTGGITSDAIPSAPQLARFLLAATAADVPFKATAGLHHALCGRYALTYEEDSPSAVMHGFLNLFTAAAFVHAGILRDEENITRLLVEEDPKALAFDDDGLSWRGRRLSLVQLVEARRGSARSYGSCSFLEPVEELAQLGLLTGDAAAPVVPVAWMPAEEPPAEPELASEPEPTAEAATPEEDEPPADEPAEAPAPVIEVREPESPPPGLDITHDPEIRSWVASANRLDGDFPLQNLPFGLLAQRPVPHLGVAIGDQVLDLAAATELGLLEGLPAARACRHGNLNYLMTLPAAERRALRHRLFALLSEAATPQQVEAVSQALCPRAGAELLVPARIGDYTDFYASVYHATNVGSMFRPW